MSPTFNHDRFAGQVAVVTGAASGIGRACARRLLAEGAQVVLVDVDISDLALSVESTAEAVCMQVDVTSSVEVHNAILEIEAKLGRVDVLVCSAGIAGESLRTLDVTDAEWRRVFAVNCDGTFYCNRAVIQGMTARGYGRIVNVASIAGKEGNPMAAAYSASKAAVIGMTKSIGKDVASTGILVNCVVPAVIMTPILDQLSAEHVDYMIERIPLGRAGQPDEVAELVCFLASGATSFSTGAAFDISGGRATY